MPTLKQKQGQNLEKITQKYIHGNGLNPQFIFFFSFLSYFSFLEMVFFVEKWKGTVILRVAFIPLSSNQKK